MKLLKSAFVSLLITLAPGCKIIQIVPDGGYITSRSGLNDCGEHQTCTIDVENGSSFGDTFTGVPNPGYYFNGWKKQSGYLCGGRSTSCALENIPGQLTAFDIDTYLSPEFLPYPTQLRPDDVKFQRYVEFSAQVSLLYPAHWSRWNGHLDTLTGFQEKLESPEDRFREIVRLNKSSSTEIPVEGVENLRLVSRAPYAIGGFDGEETIYDLEQAQWPGLDFSAQFIQFEFNGQFYSLLHIAEKHSFLRNIELVRAMADSMLVGQAVFEDYELTSDLATHGRPAIASDGTDFLVVSCREEPLRSNDFSLVGRVVRQDRSMGEEFEIHPNVETYDSSCRHTQYQLVHTGESYLLVYMTLHGGKRSIVARRIDASGTLLGLEPVDVSVVSTDRGVFSPALVFDGSRSLVVWNERDDDGGSIRGAFISPNGAATAPFTVAANLAQHHPGNPDYIFTPEVATSSGGFMVVWNRYYFGHTLSAIARPLYGQALDLAGNKLSSEPLLIREDAGTNPRYADVVSDGENYLVGWIEGTLPTNTVHGGKAAIYARQISTSGEFLSGATAPVLIVGEAFPETSGQTSPPTKEFLDITFDGRSYTAIWSANDYGDDAGLYAVEVSTDLADVSVPFAVSGTGANGLKPLSNVREPTIAYSDTTGIIGWISTPLEAWVFDKQAGISALNTDRDLETTYPLPGNTATATLARDELQHWFMAVEQVSQIGRSALFSLSQLSASDIPPGAILQYCDFGGAVLLAEPSENGLQRLSFDDCAVTEQLSMAGVLSIRYEPSQGGYDSKTLVSTDDFTVTRHNTVHWYSGEFTVLSATLGLSDPRLRFSMEVTTADGIPYQLAGLGFSIEAENTSSQTNAYGFFGHLQTPGGNLQAHSGALGTPVQILGRAGNRAEFKFEQKYSEILFYQGNSSLSTAGVRLDKRASIDFVGETDWPPHAVNHRDFSYQGVQTRLYSSADQGVQGVPYAFDVSGTITDLNADTLEYTVNVSQVERVTDRGDGTSELISAPRFSLARISSSSFALSAQDAGKYTLQILATDSRDNVSDMQEVHVTIRPDTDGDGFLDESDRDDDDDGIADFDDAFPKDPTETLDNDADGIGDSADLDDDNDGTDDAADLYPLNAICAHANEGNGSECYADFVGGLKLLFDNAQTLYFFERGSSVLPRWKVDEERFVDQIVLGSIGPADDVVLDAAIVAKHNRLYLGYKSGTITYINLDDASQEVFFAQLGSPVVYLEDAVNFLLAFRHPTGVPIAPWGLRGGSTVFVVSQSGEVTAEADAYYVAINPYLYDEAQQLYYDNFESGDLDINTGKIIAEQDKIRSAPLAASPDGAFSLRANGEILDVNSLASIAKLSGVSAGTVIWTDAGISYINNGDYYRVDKHGGILERFEAPLERYSRHLYPYGDAVLHVAGGVDNGGPLKLSIIRPSDDTDGDGVDNLADPFPNNATASLDADHDGYADAWNEGHTAGGSSTLVLDAYPGAVDCYLPEHGNGSSCDPATNILARANVHFVSLGNDGIVYMLGYQQRIYRYSLTEKRYLGSLRVGSTNPYFEITGNAEVMVYSSAENRLYLGYRYDEDYGFGPRVTYLDLANPLQEIQLTALEEVPKQLLITDDYVVVGVDAFETVRYFYDKAGNLIQTSDYPRFQRSMAWDETQNLLYSLAWPQGVYVEALDPAAFTGEATLLANIPFQDKPILVSRDGKYLVSHTNEVYNAVDGSVFTVLPHLPFSNYLWLSNGGLAALTDDNLSIYNADLEVVPGFENLPVTPGIALLERNGMLVIVTRPRAFEPYGFVEISLP